METQKRRGKGEEKKSGVRVQEMDPAVLDGVIRRLLEVRGKPGKQVQLSESEIRQLCVVSKGIFLRQPNLLEIEAPIKICGIFLHRPLHVVLLLIFSFFDHGYD